MFYICQVLLNLSTDTANAQKTADIKPCGPTEKGEMQVNLKQTIAITGKILYNCVCHVEIKLIMFLKQILPYPLLYHRARCIATIIIYFISGGSCPVAFNESHQLCSCIYPSRFKEFRSQN